MTPLEIEIILHYHCCTNEYRDGDLTAPAVRECIEDFLRTDMLELRPTSSEHNRGDFCRTYDITERGRVFVVDGLCRVPLPIREWTMPMTITVTE